MTTVTERHGSVITARSVPTLGNPGLDHAEVLKYYFHPKRVP